MNKAKNYLIVIVLVCISAFCGYVYGGKQQQVKLDQHFALLNYSAWAIEVKGNVKLLELLEAKKYKDAENLLENFLDVRLSSIALYDRLAADYPDNDIFSAIDIAKKHREQYTAHQVNPNLAPSVARAFKITERKGS